MFNQNVKRVDLGQGKFTFSPQRIELDKGQLIMLDAIRLAKSDFVVLQIIEDQGNIMKKPSEPSIVFL